MDCVNGITDVTAEATAYLATFFYDEDGTYTLTADADLSDDPITICFNWGDFSSTCVTASLSAGVYYSGPMTHTYSASCIENRTFQAIVCDNTYPFDHTKILGFTSSYAYCQDAVDIYDAFASYRSCCGGGPDSIDIDVWKVGSTWHHWGHAGYSIVTIDDNTLHLLVFLDPFAGCGTDPVATYEKIGDSACPYGTYDLVGSPDLDPTCDPSVTPPDTITVICQRP